MDSNTQMIRDDLHPVREALIRADKAFASLARTPWFIDAGLGGKIHVMGARQAIEKALAEPLRNCDVGSVKEQYHRFCICCTKHEMPCRRSYTFGCAECYANWAQMPYEAEKGDNDGK